MYIHTNLVSLRIHMDYIDMDYIDMYYLLLHHTTYITYVIASNITIRRIISNTPVVDVDFDDTLDL